MWGWLPGRLILSGPCSWVRAGRGVAARGKQGGWLWLLVCLGRWWSGPAGGAASAEGRVADRVSWVGSRGCGWLVW